MAKRTLTDRLIKSLKPAKPEARYDVMDSVVPGLGIRVTSNGAKTFVLVARFPGSKNPTRRALGEYDALTLTKARQKARDWLELIGRGIDPRNEEERQRAAELRQRKSTFAAVAEDFIKDKLAGERKGREVERDIRREFLPRWGKLPISQVTEDHIREVVKAAKDRGAPYQAHNLLTTARRLFSWAIDQRAYGLESSPCDRLRPKKLIGQKNPRTRTLKNDEWRALWRATECLGYPYGPLFQILALTGQRKSEVGEARWREFDLDQKLWTIPPERMKADAAHEVPLTDGVIEILKSLPRFNKGDHLFSTDFGAKPVNGFSKGKARLDQAMVAELGRAIDPYVIHDIRRSMRTGLSALPVSDLVRELVIAHTKPGLHKVYDQHAYADEKRRALDLWAARLRNIVASARADKVVTLHGAA
jgi:integrase